LTPDQRYNRKLRLKILTYYSHGMPRCKICNEQRIEFLSIDHVNNNGAKLRKIEGSGIKFYRWLCKNHYPKGYQVLCHNCNAVKQLQLLRSKAISKEIPVH
jgi:hypothetical protein